MGKNYFLSNCLKVQIFLIYIVVSFMLWFKIFQPGELLLLNFLEFGINAQWGGGKKYLSCLHKILGKLLWSIVGT
jgi:hypothetical protein